jgi:hypothetical protein
MVKMASATEPAQRLALDACAVFDGVEALDGRLDHPLHEHGRRGFVPGLGHRGHDADFERGLVLLEIERHLLVGDLAQQRTGEEPGGRPRQHHAGDDAEPEDGRG